MKDFGMFFEVAEKVGKKKEALEVEKVFEGM